MYTCVCYASNGGDRPSFAYARLCKLSGLEKASLRKLGVVEQTYYRWRREYGGMKVEQAKRLKELEKENVRLKKLVADVSLDNAILKEAARGNPAQETAGSHEGT